MKVKRYLIRGEKSRKENGDVSHNGYISFEEEAVLL